MGDAERMLIHKALRFAVWAAGEGIAPVDGEPARDPEEFLTEYSAETDDGDWETLPERIIDALEAQNKRLRKALEEIANLSERPYDKFPSDWRDQIAACPECQRYKDHPIQRGICDDHRKPLYDREDHNRHETSVLGYRAKSIAREALAALEALSADKEASAK